MGRRLGVVVVVEIACTLSKCVTRWRSASCWMVAAEAGSLSVASAGAGATGAGSMLDESVPSLLQAQNLHFVCRLLAAYAHPKYSPVYRF